MNYSESKLGIGLNRYLDAIELAHKAHAVQKYGEFPYTRHLAHVESVLQRFGFSSYNLMTIAWLHDILEDTCITRKQITEIFGEEISNVLYCVTDEPGKNRKERKRATYPKIRQNNMALIVKLADRIANIESCIHSGNNGLLSMYRKEQKEFSEELRNSENSSMWEYIESLLQE